MCTRICSMSASGVSLLVGAAVAVDAAASSAAAASLACEALIRCATTIRPAPTSTNGSFGMPGSRASASAPQPAMSSAVRDWDSCLDAAVPMSPSAVARVTTMPVDTDSSRAGIWVTRPSPMVSRLNRSSDSVTDRPIWTMPMTNPPMRLISVMMMPAIASPLTNFEPPSMAP